MVRPHIDRPRISLPGDRLRASRWLLLLSVPLLLLSLLVMSMQNWQVALAADSTVGDCTGSQTHATIQEAVTAAVSGTVINICPDVYSESVNLTLMNPTGDITLRKAPGQDGEVLIAPLVGAGIHISFTDNFTGNITIESINISSVEGYGIDFFGNSAIVGNLVLSDVVASNNGFAGADVSVAGDLLVINSHFDDNEAQGLWAEAYQYVDIINTTANNNGNPVGSGFSGTGIELYAYGFLLCNVEASDSAYVVNIEDTIANDNAGWGIHVDSTSDVTVVRTEVYSNAYDGMYIDAGSCISPPVATIVDSEAEYNGWDVYEPKAVGDVGAASTVDDWGGFRLLVEGGIDVIEGTESNENVGFGYCLYSDGPVYVSDSLAEDNLGDGFFYGLECTAMIDFSEGDAEGAGEIEAADFEAAIDFYPTVVFTASSAISNTGTGFKISDPYIPVTITKISATENLTGVAFSAPSDYSCDCGGGAGIGIQGALPSVESSISNSLIQNNAVHGLYYGHTIYDIRPVAHDIYTSTHSANSNIICENGIGLEAEQYILEESVTLGYIDEPNALLVDAQGNYWGALSGPDAPDNPDGEGDTIISTVVNAPTNTVTVDYDPWIDFLFANAAPNPTLLSIPVDIAYQFSGGVLPYFLENGVGDPNNGPLFNLSPTNGTVNGDAGKFIVNSVITGSVTPSGESPLTITLNGPCGLDSTQEVPVAEPNIDVEKTPDAQGVAEHDSAVFTVTVTNTGNITLTDITVGDPLVSSCARATGVLGDLGVSASTSYTCTLSDVTNNLTNTVTAEAYALINGNPAGDPVSDSDTANVYVASFIFSKTVYVDGYFEWFGGTDFNDSECPVESDITVPPSTTVKYCYTLTNTGDYPLAVHTLIDSHVAGAILDGFPAVVQPGESFSNIDADARVTATLTVSTTNVATWTAEIAAPTVDVDAEAVDASIPVVVYATATVEISSPTLDQDEDGTPDVEEGSGDTNTNGIPNFLDPAGPTNEPPTNQPEQRDSLFLPSLGNND